MNYFEEDFENYSFPWLQGMKSERGTVWFKAKCTRRVLMMGATAEGISRPRSYIATISHA
jgi:hypothetical protein